MQDVRVDARHIARVLREAADLALALPNAALVEIPGNHMSAVTKPDFGTALAAWLQHA